MKTAPRAFAGLLMALVLAGCATAGGPRGDDGCTVVAPTAGGGDGSAELALVALGDFGESAEGRNIEVAEALRAYLAERRVEPSGVLLLGDNFYPNGLIGADTGCAPWTTTAPDAAIRAQLAEVVAPFDFLRGRAPFWLIAGNHDHACPRLGGLANQAQVDRWLHPRAAWGDAWSLVQGMPRQLVDSTLLRLVAIDSEPMIQNASMRAASAAELEALLARRPAQWTIVAGHHPLYSNGEQNGAGAAGALAKALYYPSHLLIFPPFLYGGQSHYEWRYRAYRNALEAVFARRPVDVFVAGHAHQLEWLAPARPGQPFSLVSGAAARCAPVVPDDDTRFAAAKNGFAMLYVGDASLRVEFVGTTGCDTRAACARPATAGTFRVLYTAELSR
jgi:hypothetical protein